MVPALFGSAERSGPDGPVAPTEDDLASPAAHSDAHDPAGCPARSVAVAPDGSVPRDPADSPSDDFHPDALPRAGSLPASRLDDSRSEDLRPDGCYPACLHSAGSDDSHQAGLVDSAPDDLRSVGSRPADLHPDGCCPACLRSADSDDSRQAGLAGSAPDGLRSVGLRPAGCCPVGSVDSHRAALVDSAPDDLRSVGLHPADLHLVDCQAVPYAHWPLAGCRDDCPAYPECP